MTTRLSLTATPGRPYAVFVAKAEAAVLSVMTLKGLDALTGDDLLIVGVAIEHGKLRDVGTNAHAQIDTHIATSKINSIIGVTSGYTALSTDAIITCGAGNQTFTITLPAVSPTNKGKAYHIKNVGTGTITIDGDGAETIDGTTTKLLAAQYDCMSIVSNGTAWWII
jgi:hypothetical protein